MTVTSTNHMPVVRINAPEWYEKKGWREFISSRGVATGHIAGEKAGEYSDVFFTYADGGDGSNSPRFIQNVPGIIQIGLIPKGIWKQIERVVKKAGHTECLVWVSNVAE